MNIGIDGRILDWKYSGIARYVWLLLSLDVFDNATIYFPGKTTLTLPEKFRKKVLKNPFKRREFYEQITLPYHLKKDKINLFIQPYNFGIPFLYSGKSILIVFDIIPLLFKDYFYYARHKRWAKWNYEMSTKIALQKATKVICDSKSAKNDLLKYFPKLNKAKVDYIYYGFEKAEINEEINFEKFKEEKGIKTRYILDNAGLEDRKNAHLLLEAFQKLDIEKRHNLQIVITGFSKYYFDKLVKMAEKFKIRDRIVFTDSVSEDEKNTLIKNADLLVNPSRFEGFGIPLLEAASFKKPIIVSDIPVFLEIGGNYPIYFKDNDADDLKNKLNFFYENKTKEAERSEKSAESQLDRFKVSEMKEKWENLLKNL